jgi:hypothetical protein
MANDWIKMRTDLYRDPKVCIIADLLMSESGQLARYVNQNCGRDMSVTRNVMRNVTVGSLVAVWGVMRLQGKRHGNDLVMRHAKLSVIDDIADLPGLGDAMAFVEWAVESDLGVIFPNFFNSYNVDPNEDSKKNNAERQRRHREKVKQNKEESNENSNVTVTSQSNAREEKRRVLKDDAAAAASPPATAEPEKPKPVRRGERLADDWTLPDAWRTWCQNKRPELNPDDVARTFSNYWRAKAGKDATKLDWYGTWQNWVDRQEAPRVRLVANSAVNNFVGGK